VTTTDLPREQTAAGDNLPDHDVADINLAPSGVTRIEWAEREMPVLRLIRQRFEKEQPLKGMRIGACLHVTTETANLMRTLKAGGAEVALCASNLLSTQDDVAAALVAEYGISVFARRGVDRDGFYRHLNAVADTQPHLTQDDGCDLVTLLHRDRTDVLGGVLAGTEETTTGIIRLRAMAADGALKYPVVGVNESKTKHMFDNRFGTGQSTVDGLLRATNILLAGRHVVVAGFGWVGKGIASRMRGMGAQVAVVEVDPIVAIEAVMEGYQVMPGIEAAAWGEVFITATGNLHVFRKEHFERMPNGAIMANSGHFDAELDLVALKELAGGRVRDLRRDVEEYDLGSKKLYVLAQGRLLNLAAAEGHPAAVMDMSFANQALAAEYGAKNHASLSPTVHVMPDEIDREVARLKLEALKVGIDKMTPEQERYVKSWQEGT
jgi:adenosylhomocysteinase